MRKEAFKALVGSHNYNLNDADSDKDYKLFYYPTFDDLYFGDKVSKSKVSKTEDIEFHDIRKLPDMLWKSNVNFMEVLFSTEVVANDNLYKELHQKRESIARMNLPYLYDACMGMYFNKRKSYDKQNEKGDEKAANKHIMGAFRILDFLFRYQQGDFLNFEESINYHNEDPYRDFLFTAKEGKVFNVIDRLNNKLRIIEEIKHRYKDQELDHGVNKFVIDTVKHYVKENIYEELN